MAKPQSKKDTSPALIAIRNFKSQWFLIPQGTSIIAVVLHQLRYQFDGLTIIADIFWVLAIVLLLLSLATYIARLTLFPRETVQALASQINETACLASITITFTSIVQMMDLALPHVWGHRWGMAAYVMWWVNVAMATVACIGLPYIFVKYQPPGVSGLGPAVNLPIIAALTAASGGGVICRYGSIDASLQVPVIIVSYLLLGMALPIALGFGIVFLARLLDGDSPSGISLYQDMLICGPWGQGSFALQILGAAVMRGSFADYARGVFLTVNAAQPVGFASILMGLMAWGQGTFWWAFAIVSILHEGFNKRARWRELKFGLPAWALVFPWGVYTNACIELGTLLDSRAFAVWGTALAIMLVIIWLVNSFLTLKGVFTGSILELEHGWNKKAYRDQQIEKGEGDK